MWYEIFKFEIKYRIKRADTYIFFMFLFLFSIVGVDFIFQGIDLGLVKKNSPMVVAKTMAAITGISMIIASMIMGVSVLRDFEYNVESLLYVNPIKKRDYLLGRFLGSFLVLLFVFSGVLIGMILGEFMPWHHPNDLLPFNFLSYFNSFLLVTLPILFFGAALFFVTGALTKKLMVVYTQGIIFFVIFMLTKAIKNETLQAILDPFSLTTLTAITKNWSVAERNLLQIPFNGLLVYSKLFWLILGIVILAIGYYKFNFNVVKSKTSKKKIQNTKETKIVSEQNYKTPKFSLRYGFKAQYVQLIAHSLFYFKAILKQTSFWAIVVCGMIIILINSVNLGTVYDVDSYPATYFIVEELQETSMYFFIIILVFYSGELIWKERGAQLNLIYDATPMSDFVNLAGKFIGLLLIYTVLMLSLIVSGILFQTISGYYQYELDVYFYGFFLEVFPFLVLYTFIAFLFQVIINQKFVAIIAVLFFFILNIALGLFGFDHDLYQFGGNSLGTYSDMNGYGHFLKPYLLIKAYWFVFGIILLIIASVFSVRGTETNFIKRWKSIKKRLTKPMIKFGISSIVVFVLLGSYIFYNTNILNDYWTNSREQEFRVSYEKNLKKFEYKHQPRIVDVNLKFELYPETRDYTAEGFYILTNNKREPITEIHIQKLIDSQLDLEYLSFNKTTTLNSEYEKFDYYIYELKEALQKGDSIKMNFKQTYTTKGFEEGGSNVNIVYNGTFFSNKDFPTLGYNKKYEIRDANEREDFQLKPRVNKVDRDNKNELGNSRTGSDSDGINFEIVIGTTSNQIAIAPGKLKKKWIENNRSYFHYKMDKPMINFYSIISARYEVMRDKWIPSNGNLNPVDLEVYYHKGHDYNLDRMMKSMKVSLDYFSANFSPYQYKQMRIMEFPRYAEFAQSLPNTVPFSEGIGFVLDIDDKTDVDMVLYITAHELAHQWFGMQVAAANVQGKNMILETLAQYAALMVLKKHYSEEKVQQFLTLQLDTYNKGKLKEKKKEAPLVLVENQNYIYYAKGAINMYALQKYIGENNVNLALNKFIKDWNTLDNFSTKKRYATTEDLMKYFRGVTPDNLQYIITDLFETVTKIDNN